MSIVLDASAVIAFLFKEPGGDVAAANAYRALLSSVNFIEVLAKARQENMPLDLARQQMARLDIAIMPFDQVQADIAGEIEPGKGRTRLSLADRCCLALAIHRGLPVLTGDRIWAERDLGLDIRLIR